MITQVVGKSKAGAPGEVFSFGQIAGDLAALDKVALKLDSPKQRLRFVYDEREEQR